MKKHLFPVILLLLAGSFFLPQTVFSEESDFTIGILSAQSKAKCTRQWQATALELSEKIVGANFTILPLGYDDFENAVKTKQVDYILSDPGMYVQAESLYGAERIATLKTSRHWKGYPLYGGTIFCKASRKDLKNLEDLKNKKFAAPHPSSFAGWLAVKRELLHHKINPDRFFSSVQFSGSDEKVIADVLSGAVDAGSIRSGTLEQLFQEGKIQLGDFTVFESQPSEKDSSGFPFLHSTGLYPEWAFARLPHTDPLLAEKIARTLLDIAPDDLAAVTGQYNGWTFPRNYQSVLDCLKELRLPPYKDYGKVTPAAALKTYWPAVLLALFLFALMAAITLYVSQLNQSLQSTRGKLEKEIGERKKTEHLLRNSEQMLMRAYGEMEKKVEERTEELRKKLIELERFRKATIDREFRMKEIEAQLEALKNKPKES